MTRLITAVLLVFLAIPVNRAERSLLYTKEMAAIRQISTVHTAQTLYYSRYRRYASSMAELISGELASGTMGGYRYILRGEAQGYTLNVNPVLYDRTGRRSFFSDQTLVIRENRGPEPATARSGEIR